MKNIRVLQIGLGPLGLKIAEFIEQRKRIETVAAIDKNPELKGRKLSELKEGLNDVVVQGSATEAIEKIKPHVAVITTVSDMQRITPQILEVVNLGIPVVSTCEELSYPWVTAGSLAQQIDSAAKDKNVAVLGTGINPGFLMDSLPTFLTSVCQQVEKVRVMRYQDAAYRRRPFQKKIGAGNTPEEFEERKRSGDLRHVGLTESIQFIAAHLGWSLDKTEDIISPVLADKEISVNGVNIAKGLARGVRQVGRGYDGDEVKIELIFQATIGEEESYDQIEISGNPFIRSKIEGGVHGDTATCAITVNACKSILSAQPGLRVMSDVPMPAFFS